MRLQEYFENNNKNAINKWLHYFEIYERHFSKYVGKEVSILEIGVFQGGSLQMWKNYFGSKAKIYAIDVYEPCKQFEEENIKIFIGSQNDREFLKSVKDDIPKIDILIDDGGHFMDQQITTFEELYSHIKPQGIYLCEDTHTSYWENYGGGLKKNSSFIEYTKNLIDNIHAWHLNNQELPVTEFTKTTHSIHYYDSIVVIEKKEIEPPISIMKGNIILGIHDFPENKTNDSADLNRNKFINLIQRYLKNKLYMFNIYYRYF